MIKLFTPIALFIVFFVGTNVKAQEQKLATAQVTEILKGSNWNTMYSSNALGIDYIVSTCPNKDLNVSAEKVLLRFNNPSNAEVKIEFDFQLYYNAKCYGCDDNIGEFHKSIILNPKKVKEGSCEDKDEKALYIFSKWVDFPSKETLTAFKISNIKVTPIQGNNNNSK